MMEPLLLKNPDGKHANLCFVNAVVQILRGLFGNRIASNLEGIIIAVLFIIMRLRDAKKFGNFKFFF